MSSSDPPRNPELILKRLEWTVIRRLDGLLHGDYRTLFRGFGLDLADLREYQYHDDVRHIDWNVTARLDTPYVREYHEDRDVTAWFLLDLSPSIDFGSREMKKRSVSSEFVTVLARLLSRHGNRIGALFYGDRVDTVIPAKSGRRHVLHILHAMLTLARLSLRHELTAVRLYDPLEMELPDLGMVTVQDAETGEQVLVDTHDRRFRKRFAFIAEQREKALRSAFRQAGVDALELSTDDDLVDTVLRFADLRKRRSQLAGGAGRPSHLEPTRA